MDNHLERALVLLQQSRLDLAEKELRMVLAQDPDNPSAHIYLALCLHGRDDLNGAESEARQGVHLDPERPMAFYVLADVLHSRRRFDEAEQSIREALRLNPEDADFHAMLGQILFDQGRWQEALTAAEQGLEHDAEHVSCNNVRAMALVKLGRNEEAGATLQATLARDPENAYSHANQGWVFLHQRNVDKALEHFREALRIDPMNGLARAGLVEGLKARYFIYGLFLRYMLWMGKLSEKGQWAIILGAYALYRVLLEVAEKNPGWRPWVTPILVVYLAFVVLTWLAVPLFNLLLRFNRYGRYALTDDQRLGSTWLCVFLVAALVSLVVWIVTRNSWAFLGMIYSGC